MKSSDAVAFQELLAGVYAFYGKDVTEFTLGVWWQACKPFDMQQVTKAMTEHAMDPERGRFAPLPADIVRVLQGTQTDRALVAWGRVYEAIRRTGAYQDVDLGDPAAHAAVVDMGGWPAICRSEVDELPFLQRRFCDLYRSYLGRDQFEYPERLAGESSAVNAGKGLGSPVRVLLAGKATQATAIASDAIKRLTA